MSRAWFPIVLLLSVSLPATAQDAPRGTIDVAGGLGVRGSGNTGVCCGPFARDIGTLRSPWIGGSLGRRLAPALNLEASVDWSADPEYVAAVQGAFAGAPVRGYLATTRGKTATAAGLLRLRVARTGHASWDVVGGVGVGRQRSSSHLRSVTFRPGLVAVPDLVTDLVHTRHRATSILGVDLAVPVRGVSLVTQCRVYTQFGAIDAVRTDLELGRAVLRIGLAVRRSF